MKTLADIKRALATGSRWECYHHQRRRSMGVRTVARVQAKAVAFDTEGGQLSWLYFPQASCCVGEGENTFSILAESGEKQLTYTRATDTPTDKPTYEAMITIDNVLTEYKKLDQARLPAALQAAEFAFIADNLDLYGEDRDIREAMDLFIEKLNEHTAAAPQRAAAPKPPAPAKAAEKRACAAPAKQRAAAVKEMKVKPAKPRKPKYQEGQALWWFDNDGTLKRETIRRVAHADSGEPVYQTAGVLDWKYTEGEILSSLKSGRMFLRRPAQPVAKTSVVVNLIRRYAALHGKQNPKEAVRRLLAALQRAIIEGQIRQANPYAKEVATIQQNLVTMVNVSGSLGRVALPNVAHYQGIGGSQKVMACARLVKRFIGIQGRDGVEAKAERLLQQVQDFLSGHDKAQVPYWAELQEVERSLCAYLDRKTATPQVSEATLRGLMGVAGLEGVEGCGCAEKALSGQPLSSVELMKQRFTYLRLKKPWADLIGSMDEPFKIMLYGKDGNGKSSAAMSLAGYFAREHGRRVLYVSDEEQVSGKLQERVRRFGLAHPGFFVVDKLPGSLAGYEVVCLDSVSSMGIEPAELEGLAKRHPGVSWIYVFQTTKEGEFRGSQEYAHNVDARFVVTEGVVAQGGKNRYGGKGSFRIF